MIHSISMRDCATYPSDGVIVDNCQKINFFYGANGSGKSTLSKFLANPADPTYCKCDINWCNDIHEEIVVYNKDFRERHFREDIDGVFTLGQATIEQLQELENLKKNKRQKEEQFAQTSLSLQKKIERREQHKDDFRDTVWEAIFKENDTDFQAAFIGLRASKERFRDQVIKQYEISHSSSETRESLLLRSKTLLQKKPEKVGRIELSIDNVIEQMYSVEANTIWTKKVIGNDDLPISQLINYLDNSAWVNQGRDFLEKRKICPFCQQNTISDDFERQINQFFSGEYETDTKEISSQTQQYQKLANLLLLTFESVSETAPYADISGIDFDNYNTLKTAFKAIIQSAMAEMEKKAKEPSAMVSIPSCKEIVSLLTTCIFSANELIDKHNNMVENYNTEREKLIGDIWAFLMDTNEAIISSYLNDLNDFEKGISGIKKAAEREKNEITELEVEIIEAGKNVTSVQPAVDEINRSLKAYGFTNFLIAPSPKKSNSYQIQRMDGSLATNTLSEGEETFISFLYFLQYTKGSPDISKVSTRRIVVLDDPICSLDSTVLYIVSSMVKSLIKGIREGNSDVDQLFVLTHNVFFHKEASFIDGRTKEINDINYWIISKDNNTSTIRPYGKVNPIKSSYELLWAELKNSANSSLVTTQNIMRRILENYFGILGKVADDKIVESFPSIEEQTICRSLISWINDGSHTIPDDLYIDSYTDSIDKYKEIFHKVFIQMGHEEHYNMMMA